MRNRKAVELAISGLLLIGIGISLGLRVSYERQFNLYVGINLLMMLSLICKFQLT
jgi:hypothetical protein